MKKGYWYIVLTTVIFSTMEIALKLVGGSFHPIQLTFTRFFIGGLFLIPFALRSLRKKNSSIVAKDLVFFAFLGLLGIVVSMGLYQLAVLNTTASVVAVLFSCNPVFVTVLAFVLLKETIQRNNVVALLLEVAGTVLIIHPLHTRLSVPGVTLTILSTVTFALYGVCGKKKCAKYGGIVVTCFSFLFGSLEMLAFIGLSHVSVAADCLRAGGLSMFADIPLFSGYTLQALPGILYICVVNTGIGFACYFKAMEVASVQKTSLIFFFKPILAPILALVLLHEIIPLNMVAGILLILIGSLASILPGIRNQRSAQSLEKAS